MLIICPSCATAYRIDLANLGENGRHVRCARCRTMWLATTESAVPATPDVGWSGTDASQMPPASPSSAHTAEMEDRAGGELAAGDWMANPADSEAHLAESTPEIATQDISPLVPTQDAGAVDAATAIAPAGEDIESIAARRARATQHPTRQFKLSRPGLPATILMLAAMLGALITWRAPIVRLLPQTASLFDAIGLPVNLRGVGFENLKSTYEFQDGVTVLVVEGSIANVTKDTVDVPRLRFALRNSLGQEVYAWTALPARPALGPKESLAFRTRLASPPSDGRDVMVRFFTRHDLISGTR
jgi:predicted Zn finger-like uncharacterized protein